MLLTTSIRVCAVWKRAATTASSLEAEQVSSNITKTQSKATLNEPTPQGTGSGSGPRHQDTIGDTIARTRFKNVSKISYDSPLRGVNTPQSDEDSMQLKELMESLDANQGTSLVEELMSDDKLEKKTVFSTHVGEEISTHKEEMDLETAQTTTTAKLPILKQGEYDMWRLRIEQYFQVQDYALWDVIENGNC
ncbi:hypothetical protein Tco_0349268 [Tanacetum coccineum]